MIRIFFLLLLAAFVFIYWGMPGLRKMPTDKVRLWLKTAGRTAAMTLLLFLVFTGRLNWLFAILGVAAAYLLRLAPLLLNYGPHLHKLWTRFGSGKQSGAFGGASGRSPRSGPLSRADALEILGLKPGASQAEIIDAHRRLISRFHPDKGGSDYLAAQINLAKKVLLEH